MNALHLFKNTNTPGRRGNIYYRSHESYSGGNSGDYNNLHEVQADEVHGVSPELLPDHVISEPDALLVIGESVNPAEGRLELQKALGIEDGSIIESGGSKEKVIDPEWEVLPAEAGVDYPVSPEAKTEPVTIEAEVVQDVDPIERKRNEPMVADRVREYAEESLTLCEEDQDFVDIEEMSDDIESEEDEGARVKKYVGYVYGFQERRARSLFGNLFKAMKHALDFEFGSALAAGWKWLSQPLFEYRMTRHTVVYEVVGNQIPPELKGKITEYHGDAEGGDVIDVEESDSGDKDHGQALLEYLNTEGAHLSGRELGEAAALLSVLGEQAQLEYLDDGDTTKYQLYLKGQEALQANSHYVRPEAEITELRHTIEGGLALYEAQVASSSGFKALAFQEGVDIDARGTDARALLESFARLELAEQAVEGASDAVAAIGSGAQEAVSSTIGIATEGATAVAEKALEGTTEGATALVKGVAQVGAGIVKGAADAAGAATDVVAS